MANPIKTKLDNAPRDGSAIRVWIGGVGSHIIKWNGRYWCGVNGDGSYSASSVIFWEKLD